MARFMRRRKYCRFTAEGIEHDDVLVALKAMGPFKGQGYLYGRPETADQVRERLSIAGRLKVAKGKPADAGPADPLLSALSAGEKAAMEAVHSNPRGLHPGGTALDGGPILPRRARN